MSTVNYQLKVPIITPRFVIRDAVRADMQGWAALYISPKVRLHMNGPLKRTAQAWWSGQQRLFSDIDRPLSIVFTETNELVGVCGFLRSAEQDEWETWLMLRSKFWGMSTGTEVTSALIDAAFTSLGAHSVIGIVNPENKASLTMIKKLGFVFLREYSGKESWQQGHHIYSVSRDTYTSRR
jgi:[ribosomal protein S5]-alanine N-acetyltransferase